MRPFPEQAEKIGKLGRCADCIHLDPAIVEVPSVSGDAELFGGTLREVPIPDALHPPADKVTASHGAVWRTHPVSVAKLRGRGESGGKSAANSTSMQRILIAF